MQWDWIQLMHGRWAGNKPKSENGMTAQAARMVEGEAIGGGGRRGNDQVRITPPMGM